MIDDFFGAGASAAKALRRSILRYTRRPVEYNFDRLPRVSDYWGMELAFREDFFEPPEVAAKHALPYAKYASLLLLFMIGYSALDPVSLLIVSAIAISSFPGLFIRRSSTYRLKSDVQVTVSLLVVFLAGLAYVITDALPYAAMAVLAVGIPTLYCIKRFSDDFQGFVLMWLHTHPCLTQAERDTDIALKAFSNQRLGLPILIIAVLAGGSMISYLWTQVAVYAVLLVLLIKGPVFRACRERTPMTWRAFGGAMAEFVAEYFTYGRRFTEPLPGVWFFPATLMFRRRFALMLLLLTMFTFGAGTGFFFAWNAPGFQGRYVSMFYSGYYANQDAWKTLKEQMPSLDWDRLPDKSQLDGMSSRLATLRESRSGAPDERRIAIDAEIREIGNQLRDAAPALGSIAGRWYQSSPKSWIEVAFKNAFKNPGTVAASLLVALLNALLLPALFLFIVMQERLLLLAKVRLELGKRFAAEDSRTPWEWFVDRLRNSKHIAPDPVNAESVIRESDHLFMGLEAENGFPILLHQDIVAEHAYISGGSGSGKTSLGILSLLVQLIRAKVPGDSDAEGGMPPIVIIDLKGEYALLHTVREEVRKQAEREGRTLDDCFRLFTTEKGMATHYFNPLGDMTYPDRYVSDLANLVLDALELNHGPGYGRSYYSRKNYMLLHEVLKTENPATFEELCNRVLEKTLRDKEDRHQAFELLATLYGLTEFEQLKPPPNLPESQTISMRQVIEQRQVAYFWLPTVESSIIAREIANLALFSYFSAMRARAKTRAPLRQGYLVVDEFQKLAGDRFNVILQQARGFGLSAILSNQSISDLKTPSYDLRPTILQNTRLKLYFSFADCREMSDFAKRSGEELAYLRSGEYDVAADEQPDAPLFNQWKHAIKTRVTTNDMLRVTDHPLQAYMDVRSGSGYTQFGGATLPLQMFHPVRWSDFRERRDTIPWPTLAELGNSSAVEASAAPEEVDQRAAALFAQMDLRINQLDEENPQLRFS